MNAVAPGATLEAQCHAIARGGCVGLETIVFPTTPLESWQREVRAATSNAGLTPAVVILGGLALNQAGQMAYVREAMTAIAEVGAAALITPEYRAQDPLPLFPPYPAPPAHEQTCVDQAMRDIGALAAALGLRVLVEPITPFESRFCRSVADALRLCDRAGHAGVQVALDTHNMNITEGDAAESVLAAGARIGHVHLSDNNRRLPGHGHIDFARVLAALRRAGYDGWFSFECSAVQEFEAELASAIRWLRTSVLTPRPFDQPRAAREANTYEPI